MRRHEVWLDTWAIGHARVIAYGHWGPPLLWFPTDGGRAHDFEANGLLDGVAWLVDAGAVKIYCVDSYDAQSWRRPDLPLEERARAHEKFEDFVVNDVVPFIDRDCNGHLDVLVAGTGFGAFHAANFTLRRADLFPRAICLSGVYDMKPIGWGHYGDAFYFTNPMDYVANMHGDHLDWLRSRVRILLVCGQGSSEDDSAGGAFAGTMRFAELLRAKGIPHELDVWGSDVPYDWPVWRAQLAHHLPRFV